MAVVAGFDLAIAGLMIVVIYDGRHTPTETEQAIDPSLVGVTYRVPHWLIELGVTLGVIGVLLVIVGWMSSPRWSEGQPGLGLIRRPALALGSFVAAMLLSAAIALWV